MVGCMVATSLAMAPALLLAQDADFVDLDGPLLLERDRVPGLAYSSGMVMPPHRRALGLNLDGADHALAAPAPHQKDGARRADQSEQRHDRVSLAGKAR